MQMEVEVWYIPINMTPMSKFFVIPLFDNMQDFPSVVGFHGVACVLSRLSISEQDSD